jgi:hypothetical protein
VTPAGIISTVAGNGSSGVGGDGGLATQAQLSGPEAVAVDAAGNLFIADTFNTRIRKVTPDGVINTIAGTTSGFGGDGGLATSARLAYPCGVAVDAAGNVFIADRDNSRIRKVTPGGVISTVAGNGSFAFSGDGGPAASAKLSSPMGVAMDTAGNLFIADRDNNRIRKVALDGTISTVAGSGIYGFGGDGGLPASAQLAGPRAVAVDVIGNVFIGDRDNNRVRKAAVILTAPTLTSISPDVGAQGGTVNITLTGSSFFTPLSIGGTGPGTGITVSNLLVTGEATATATLTIASNAGLGTRNFTVTTNLGTGGAATFSVLEPPTLGSISPLSAQWGDTLSVTLTGSGFLSGMSINAGAGITVSNVNVLSSNSATATFAIVPGASTGARDISVTSAGAITNSTNFVVHSAPPTITTFGPAIGRRGSGVIVALTGTNFVSPMIFAAGADIGISNVTITSPNAASAALVIGPGATLGDRTIGVTTSDGASNTSTFTVLPSGQQDLNGDGGFDLLWYNAPAGQTTAWLMNGTNVSTSDSLLTDPNWRITGTADLNGDGKSDLLWYNAATGQTSAWLMNGTSAISTALLLTDRNWKITGTADLNGDGKSDLLWYNAATGQTSAWLMNGGSVSSFRALLTDLNMKVIQIADLNGDGKSDLIWYNAVSGATSAWLMNGLIASSTAPLLTSRDWKVSGAADLNGDGKSDLIWYNTAAGQTAAWLMNGFSVSSAALLMKDPNWKITTTADFDGDGKSDLLWVNAISGETAAWLMNGFSVSSNGSLLSDANWKVTDTPDLNGDGKSDLIWYNATTGQTSVWLMNGRSVSNFAPLLADFSWKALSIIPGKTTNSP